MSRGFTEAEAATKECPFRHPSMHSLSCLGETCMLWRWRHQPETQKMVVLPFVKLAGQIVPTVIEQDPAVKPAVEDFPVPEGEGWVPSETGPVFMDNSRVWVLTFFNISTERRGVCGAAMSGEAA